MKIIRNLVTSSAFLLFCTPLLLAQGLSSYRNFSFGMTLVQVSSRAEQQPRDATQLYGRPALIQELSWRPQSAFVSAVRSEAAERIIFSFYNGELYRIHVMYDSDATEGLTVEDMVQSISLKYGTPTRPSAEISFPTNQPYGSPEKVIARWEDPEYSFNLFQSSSKSFGLVMFAKLADAKVESSIAEALRLDKLEAPKKELDHQKKEADNLELARQRNKKSFRP